MALDSHDRALIAELGRNGRASITELAGRLGLTRATVKARLDRLQATGTIQGFTVVVNPADAVDQVRAIVLIQLQGSLSRQVIRALGHIPQIAHLHATNGSWDLVAELTCTSLSDFDHSLRQIREVRGVLNSESCLLLDTLARD